MVFKRKTNKDSAHSSYQASSSIDNIHRDFEEDVNLICEDRYQGLTHTNNDIIEYIIDECEPIDTMLCEKEKTYSQFYKNSEWIKEEIPSFIYGLINDWQILFLLPK